MTQKNISQAAIYDCQIRLWGLEAQQRIGNAHILIAGLRSIKKQQVDSQFFWSIEDIGKNKAEATLSSLQTLNPRVHIHLDQENISDKPDSYFEPFDIVCLFHMDIQLLMRVNEIRRKINKPFYTADAFGWIGYIFCDLVQHTFIE
ncbi:unnamed protein product [Cunninghamella echinulata]